MKLLIFSAYYEPEKAASMYLATDLYEGLAEKGCKVELFVPLPTRGVTKEERKKYKLKRTEKKCNGNLVIHRIMIVGEHNNILLRFVRYLLMNLIFIWKGLWVKADCIFVQSTPPTQGAMAVILKKLKKIPLVFNLQDVFPDSLVGAGLAKEGSPIWRIGRILENFTYRNVDEIVVISDSIKDNIVAKGVSPEKIVRVYNWGNTENIIPIEREKNLLFDRFGLDRNKFYIVYAGNLGYAQNIDLLLKVAKRLEDNKHLQFLIFGAGTQEKQYKELAKDLKLNNVKFFPLLPYRETAYVYGLGDICVLMCKKGFGGSAMPSKMWSIMATGRPILACFDENSDVERIIKKEEIGYFVRAEDQEALGKIISDIQKSPDELEKRGKRARKLVETKYSKEKAIDEYYKCITHRGKK